MIEASSMISAMSTDPASFGAVLADRSGDAFSAVLTRAAGSQEREAVREAAAQLVSSTFILPVLQSIHDSPFLEPPFAPGYAQKRFQPLLDQYIADRLTSAARLPLIDVITDRLLGAEETGP